jgi:hypothetical protein
VAEASAGRPTEAAKQGKPHMSGREGGSNCICPSRRRQLQGTASAAATATVQAAAAAAEEGAGGGCRGRCQRRLQGKVEQRREQWSHGGS